MQKIIIENKPISKFFGVSPICFFCDRKWIYGLGDVGYICEKDVDEKLFKEPCSEIDWKTCPLSKK